MATHAETVKRAEVAAAVVALAVGLPAAYALALGAADGQRRADQVPLRAFLGDDAYEALASGARTEVHYLGDDRRAPDFSLRDRRGRAWTLSDHRGKVVVMNFWTITCQPCIEEMPTLEALARIAKERDDLEVVAISTDSGWDEVRRIFLPDSELRVLFDPERTVVEGKYGTRLFPETWIIDRQGVIRLRVDGAKDWSTPLALDIIEGYL